MERWSRLCGIFEVSAPLPALDAQLPRRGDPAEDRLQVRLEESRRTLSRLLSVADKLAPVAAAPGFQGATDRG